MASEVNVRCEDRVDEEGGHVGCGEGMRSMESWWRG